MRLTASPRKTIYVKKPIDIYLMENLGKRPMKVYKDNSLYLATWNVLRVFRRGALKLESEW
jgi:hypothetical protein